MKSTKGLWFCGLALLAGQSCAAAADRPMDQAAEYASKTLPLLKQYCLACHSQKAKKGDLDLERFATLDQVRRDIRPWQGVLEALETKEMPPKKAPQPKAEDRQWLTNWVRGLLDAEARARAGDPGRVVLRRLSNAEYTYTLRDLTGIDLQPTRDFPADGAAGEGFTNAGDALVMSPTLLNKYLNAAKEVAFHAVLLPDGIRFSPARTRRDWTNEIVAQLRETYRQLGPADGKLDWAPYLSATIRYRADLTAGKISLESVAEKERLNAKYLRVLWEALIDPRPSFPLDEIRVRWRKASGKEVDEVVKLIRSWQTRLWKFNKIGSYISPIWQEAVDVKRTGDQPEPRFDDFRRCFPIYLYFPKIVPDDEVICLRLFCREDEHLVRLFLNDEQKRRIDRLWEELRFVSQQPLIEAKNYPDFMGYVSQDGPAAFKRIEAILREPVRKRTEEFVKNQEAAQPRQVASLLAFAELAYRRPLADKEKAELRQLHQSLRSKQISHEEALRTLLARVLVSPSFLYRIEQPAAGIEAKPVSDWELATRLSYFLWATMPDAELRRTAASGKLSDPKVLSAEVDRMVRDRKVRGLAIEFALQWLHVRDIRENREKNERLFPTFNDPLRQAFFEESAQFFQALFQNDRSVLEVLDADHTFLNEALAKHYGVPGVAGPQWRRVAGVKKFGRGGILGMGSVLTKQSGASRTSPVLRGNWVVEALLGEKIPKPPADVPRLPEEETGGNDLTVRQLVEKHTRLAQCAVCHVRIDPLGFALERYDPIGRHRDKDLAGRPVDSKALLRDGTKFDGIDGLRKYLLTQRRDDFLRHFCKKLLGYALGRSVTLSDHALVEEMIAALKQSDYRIAAAVQSVVRSKQFRYHRGLEATKEN